jgi:hypothetical protein
MTDKEFTHWGELFFDGNIVVKIVDRVVHLYITQTFLSGEGMLSTEIKTEQGLLLWKSG